MTCCFFVSDLHGRLERYEKLFVAIDQEKPSGVFLGGDLLPFPASASGGTHFDDFVAEFLEPGFRNLRERLGAQYPDVFLILGNDDPRSTEAGLIEIGGGGLWHYAHDRRLPFGRWNVLGYSCVPPTPFALKDWERYDVSRSTRPGCIAPERGRRSVPLDASQPQDLTIESDLAALTGTESLEAAILMAHSPPHQTRLDHAALEGRVVDDEPLDPHIGSVAMRRLIEQRQPRITLHGHVHESARLSGDWRDRIGDTYLFSAAHDGRELALVRFAPESPEEASRELL